MPTTSARNPNGGESVYGSDTLQYSDEELEFLKAIDRYKREKKRPFPTCSEVLAVAISLGYRRVAPRSE